MGEIWWVLYGLAKGTQNVVTLSFDYFGTFCVRGSFKRKVLNFVRFWPKFNSRHIYCGITQIFRYLLFKGRQIRIACIGSHVVNEGQMFANVLVGPIGEIQIEQPLISTYISTQKVIAISIDKENYTVINVQCFFGTLQCFFIMRWL